jgi:hypothetical protein
MSKAQFATIVVFLVLMTALLGALAYSALVPQVAQVSTECLAAIEAADSLPTTGDILTEYQTAAYDTAENINQQIFFANEYQVMLLGIISEQQAVLVKMTTACR